MKKYNERDIDEIFQKTKLLVNDLYCKLNHTNAEVIMKSHVIPILKEWGWEDVKIEYKKGGKTADVVLFKNKHAVLADTPTAIVEVVPTSVHLSQCNDAKTTKIMLEFLYHFSKETNGSVKWGVITNGLEWQFIYASKLEGSHTINRLHIDVNEDNGKAIVTLLSILQGNYEWDEDDE